MLDQSACNGMIILSYLKRRLCILAKIHYWQQRFMVKKRRAVVPADHHPRSLNVRFAPCVDGSPLARSFLMFCPSVGAAMCAAC
jgi:hypothetical protein